MFFIAILHLKSLRIRNFFSRGSFVRFPFVYNYRTKGKFFKYNGTGVSLI
jgi:hypothetical protein